MSRIRDPQRLVELVADTMVREATRADRVRSLNGADGERSAGGPDATDDEKRGD
ncbi:MAG: hypothetical protein ACRDL6_05080 [Solirubrobacterales bacterium]